MKLKRKLGRWLRRAGLLATPAAPPPTPLEQYLAGERKPWSEGYQAYRRTFIREASQNQALLETFRHNAPLPAGYGQRLDERVVEYPWLLTRLSAGPARVLDAGGIVVYPHILQWPIFDNKWLLIYTLAGEQHPRLRPNVSCVYGDLRATVLKDATFDEVICVSTLEHIGLDNTRLYTSNDAYREARRDDYRLALREFCRMLSPGGRLLLTVPYGRYQDQGWLQQFDKALLEDAQTTFGGTCLEATFYKYEAAGWRLAAEAECRDCVYFDIHATQEIEPDFAAAARAVACLVLSKS